MAQAQQNPVHAVMWNSGRVQERTAVQRRTTLRGDDGAPNDVILEDLSLSGFKMGSPDELTPGLEILIGLEGVGVREATVVWSQDGISGCRFDSPISQSEIDTTLNARSVIMSSFVPSEAQVEEASAGTALSRPSSFSRLITVVLAAMACWGMVFGVASGIARIL